MGLGKQALYTMPVLVLHFDDFFCFGFPLKVRYFAKEIWDLGSHLISSKFDIL